MKRPIAFFAILLLLGVSAALSQPVAGKTFELGAACSFTSFKFPGATDADTVLSLPVRFGVYVWKGLEVEPELMLLKFSDSDTAYHLSGNLSYNFKLSGPLVPFVLGGAGFGNGFSAGPIMEGGSGLKAFLINAGAGVKVLLGGSGALRVEYRFTRNRLSEEGFESESINFHQVLVGASIFF